MKRNGKKKGERKVVGETKCQNRERKFNFKGNFNNPGLEEPKPDLSIQKCDTNSSKNCSTDGIARGGIKILTDKSE